MEQKTIYKEIERLLKQLPTSSRIESSASGFIVRVYIYEGGFSKWQAFKAERLEDAYEEASLSLAVKSDSTMCAFCENEASELNGLCDACNWYQHFGERVTTPDTYA